MHLSLVKSSVSGTLIPFALGILGGYSSTYILMVTVGGYTVPNMPFTYTRTRFSHGPHHHSDLEDVKDVGTHSSDEEFHKDEDMVAKQMAEKVRVLCWVMTSPSNYETKARHVKATWGPRCNILLFMSSTNDSSLPSIALPVKEGRDYLWAKTKEAFKYVLEHYSDQADWFMKADDDTYVVVENLRYMLSAYSHEDPLYFGCRFKPFTKQGFMSGGAGYVLSRKAVKMFVEEGLSKKVCRQDHGGEEDVELGKCMEAIGVKAMDSRDSLGRGRFFPMVPEYHLIPHPIDKDFWYYKYVFYNTTEGMDCCSDSAISFHYVSPNLMYVMEYLIYHLRPFGISHQVKMPSIAPSSVSSTDSPDQKELSSHKQSIIINTITNW